MLDSLTDEYMVNTDRISSDEEAQILDERKTTVRGKKYEFIKKK